MSTSTHPLDGVAPDARAKDVLGRLPPRRVVGQRTSERVGARGWAPPKFASGAAIFERIGIPDPWDPSVKEVGTGLGDVGMPQTRQPAPHLMPPAPKAPAAKMPGGLPNLPQAPQRREVPEGARLAPKIGEVRKIDAKETRPKEPERPNKPPTPPPRPTPTQGPFGPYAPKHAVAKLPMRPGVSAPTPEPEVPAVTPTPVARAAPPPSMSAPPRPPPPAESSAPREAAPAAEPPAPKPPPPPVNRKPPGPSAGLDDLFGMGAENTRIRLPKAEPAGEGEPQRPRRPVVTSPEELARLGLDRRPPPPKAPDVKPAPFTPPPKEPEPDE